MFLNTVCQPLRRIKIICIHRYIKNYLQGACCSYIMIICGKKVRRDANRSEIEKKINLDHNNELDLPCIVYTQYTHFTLYYIIPTLNVFAWPPIQKCNIIVPWTIFLYIMCTSCTYRRIICVYVMTYEESRATRGRDSLWLCLRWEILYYIIYCIGAQQWVYGIRVRATAHCFWKVISE